MYLVPVLGQSTVSTPFAPPQKFAFPPQPAHPVFNPHQQKCCTRQWFLQADHFSFMARLLRNLLRWKIISLRSISRPWFRPSEWPGWSWSCTAPRPGQGWPMLVFSGLCNGFHLGFYSSSILLKSATSNMPSALLQPSIIDSYLQNELHKGRIAGPFPIPTLHNLALPFGLRSATCIFSAVADLLEWIVRRNYHVAFLKR